MDMKTHVSQRHIDEGSQGNAGDCAIARSIKERTGEHRVLVNGSGAFIGHQRFDIGEKGREFVRRFDVDKKLVEPTDLVLSPYFGSAENVFDYKYQQYQMYKAQMHQMKYMAAPMMMEVGKFSDELVTVPYPKTYAVDQKMFIGMDFGV